MAKIIEVMSAENYRRGKNAEGGSMTHPKGLSYRLLLGEEYPEGFAAKCKTVDTIPVVAAMVKELNRKPSAISARIVDVIPLDPPAKATPILDPSPAEAEEGSEAAAGDASPFAAMPWTELLKLASAKGINVNGLKRAEIEAALMEKGIEAPK